MRDSFVISITWGKSCNYLPASVEPICWDGCARISSGQLQQADRLEFAYVAWCQNHEITHPLSLTQDDCVVWHSAVPVGSPLTLEGLRLHVTGTEESVITLDFSHTTIDFSLRELATKEYLRFHAGSKYGGMPIDVFMGMDTRPRLSKAAYHAALAAENRAGCLLTPEDFPPERLDHYHSLYGTKLLPGETVQTRFALQNAAAGKGNCTVKLQLTGVLGYETERMAAEENTHLTVEIGGIRHEIDFQFTNRTLMPKLEDIYLDIPWDHLREDGNLFSFTYAQGESPVLLHRVAIGTERASLAGELPFLPPLPKEHRLHVGTETNLLTPANGDVDLLIEQMYHEEWGDYINFRCRVAEAPEESLRRWGHRVKELGFLAATSSAPELAPAVLEEILGKELFQGDQAHEISNLAYGWGDADPMEIRKTRTLKECKESYLKRMGPHRMVGQALPQQYLDYEAGVEGVMTETPTSHASLHLHGARGASYVYDKPFWGVHVANHVTRAPLDQDHVRRLFILLQQCWLHGASILQDEEVALRYNHDTIYAYSDPIPEAYRKIYQSMYHYGNRIQLETPVVSTGFLQGNYDFLIGGLQAAPWVERTKFWGAFGPESEAWEFNTPEAGWKLIDPYMPGVWLYPVLQDRTKIRLFFSGSPNGQVDLVPITAPLDKLSAYPVLFLPGWNTMTPELYDKLCEYAAQGGHLVLCTTQCTEHDTRDFLLEKKDFAFIHGGDLSRLSGVRVKLGTETVNTIRFGEEILTVEPGIPTLDTQLCGATTLATDQSGNPVLVENIIGKGKVWTLCVAEYWGADGLDAFREALCSRVSRENAQTIRLTGDTAEVDYYEFHGEDYTRVVLVNTDWTEAGNQKQVTVHADGCAFPVCVTEGTTVHLLIRQSCAVAFPVPAAIVDDFAINGTANMTLQGVGDVTIRLYTPTCPTGQTHIIPMGNQWCSRTLCLPL